MPTPSQNIDKVAASLSGGRLPASTVGLPPRSDRPLLYSRRSGAALQRPGQEVKRSRDEGAPVVP